MQTRLRGFLSALFSLMILSAFGQRQELSISPVGFLLPKNQLIQYEHYCGLRHSLTFSVAYDGEQSSQFLSRYVANLSSIRGVLGYRYYFPILGFDLGEELAIYVSARAVAEYSAIQLQPDPQLNIPQDSLRASGMSLAPEFLLGGKLSLFKRVTLSGAFGGQYYVKLVPTEQITRNQTYWRKVNSEDNDDWRANRNAVTQLRRGWSPSLQVTVGLILGKRQ